jgi:Protein of unknown function (DUF1003)
MSNLTLDNKRANGLEDGTERDNAPLVCPICGGENTPDAVFCANPQCHKALGNFKYVIEELRDQTRWHEALAERVVDFIGTSHFLVAHGVWFLIWFAINTGVFAFVRRFDEYPFDLLGIILAAEAVLIAGFVLISQNRQNAHADKADGPPPAPSSTMKSAGGGPSAPHVSRDHRPQQPRAAGARAPGVEVTCWAGFRRVTDGNETHERRREATARIA